MDMFIRSAAVIKTLGLTLLLLVASNTKAAGLLSPVNNQLPDLELAEHHVKVQVDDGLVFTEVTQVFTNPHDQDLEALYSFPIPDGAAVAELVVWIDGQAKYGEVVEKKQARQIYEKEKKKGNHVAITEKNSYKTFETRVSPIRAKQSTQVKIAYYQKLKIDHSIGRYVYPLEEGGVDEEALSFWKTNDKVTKQFSFTLDLRSSYPVDALRLPKHPQAIIHQISAKHWQVKLNHGQAQVTNNLETEPMVEAYDQANPEIQSTAATSVASLNNDIMVYWRLNENLPAGVELYSYKAPGREQGTFMLTFTPGSELTANQTGRDWVFILDRSGSMAGKYQSLLLGISKALKKLRSDDRYRVYLFDSNVEEITQGFTTVSPSNVATTVALLEKTKPGSSTNLYRAMQQGIAGLDSDRPTGLILVTDGVANVGPKDKMDFIKLLDTMDIRLFTFVMGNSANKPLLKALTKHSGGYSMNISNSDDMVGRLQQASSKLTHHAMHDLRLEINGVKTFDLTPARLPSLYRGEQLQILGRYADGGEASVNLTAKIRGENRQFRVRVNLPKESGDHPELERLWAFAKIQDLKESADDFQMEDNKQAITDLAVEYSIVSDYTSMLLVEDTVKQDYGIGDRNQQRIALETQARNKRRANPPRSRQIDRDAPTFSGNRATGGSVSYGLLLVMLILFLLRNKKPGIENRA